MMVIKPTQKIGPVLAQKIKLDKNIHMVKANQQIDTKITFKGERSIKCS